MKAIRGRHLTFLASVLMLFVLFSIVSDLEAANPEKQTEKFITAIQKKDFKTIFDMTEHYQMELSRIKANNPKALWQKLVAEYYESKKKAFPQGDIRELMGLLIPLNKWNVIESKKDADKFIVYVSIAYKSVEESPLVGSKFLKKTILSFAMDGKTGLYMRSSRVEKGDAYWGGDPQTDLRVAQNLTRYGRWDDTISILENLQSKGVINKEGKILLASAYFVRVQGKGFANYGEYRGLDKYYDWRRDIDKAISLNPDVRSKWVRLLSGISSDELIKSNNYEGDVRNIIGAVFQKLIVASEFAQGYPELEKLIYKPKLDLAKIYLDMARTTPYYLLREPFNNALTLLPNDSLIKQKALEIIKYNLVAALSKKNSEWITTSLEILDKWKFSIEFKDIPLFSKSAGIASRYCEWPGNLCTGRSLYWKQKEKDWQEKNPEVLTDEKMEQFFTAQHWNEKGIEALGPFHNANLDEAIKSYKNAITLDPNYADAYYNLACAYSLQGNESVACEWLSKSIEKGYRNFKHIKRDSDLKNIRNSDCYKRIISGR